MPSAKILEAKKAYVAELNTKIAGIISNADAVVRNDNVGRASCRERVDRKSVV